MTSPEGDLTFRVSIRLLEVGSRPWFRPLGARPWGPTISRISWRRWVGLAGSPTRVGLEKSPSGLSDFFLIPLGPSFHLCWCQVGSSPLSVSGESSRRVELGIIPYRGPISTNATFWVSSCVTS